MEPEHILGQTRLKQRLALFVGLCLANEVIERAEDVGKCGKRGSGVGHRFFPL